MDLERCSGTTDGSGELDQEREQGEWHAEPISKAPQQSQVPEPEETRLVWAEGKPMCGTWFFSSPLAL